MLADRYKIIKEFKAGGFSQTFLAKDLEHPEQQRCVIKKLQPQATDDFTVQTARQFFVKEVNVLKQLGHHTQIPQLYNTFYVEHDFYLVEEYIEGHSLAHEFRRERRWSETKVLALLQNILSPLTFVHDQGVIHCDLKPENLIRRKSDQSIVIIDFGCIQNHENNSEAIVGTDGYVPHEQLLGKPSLGSDVYTVGMIAIQALTGINPNRDPFPTHERTGDILWHQFRTISSEFAHELDKMVRCDVKRRYGSAKDALNAVNALIPTLDQANPKRWRFLENVTKSAKEMLKVGTAHASLAPTSSPSAVSYASVPEVVLSSPLLTQPSPSLSPTPVAKGSSDETAYKPISPPANKETSLSIASDGHLPNQPHDIQPLPAPILVNKTELINRYGSYNGCRKAAKARGITFNCTPTWTKLTKAFSYAETIHEMTQRYMEIYPNRSLTGVKIEVNLDPG